MNQLPVSRSEAKSAGLPQYFTGKPCKQGHLAPKFTNNGSCAECLLKRRREYMKRWAAENPELKKQRAAEWYDKKRDEVIERVRANYYKDLEKSRQRARDYAATHAKEAVLRVQNWKKNNPEKAKLNDINRDPVALHAAKAKYRAAKRQACPSWVDKAHMARIHVIYRLRREISEQTGITHEVDHIVPLQGKTVCGLHVWWNLRVIPKEQNNRRPRIWSEDTLDTPAQTE